MARSAAPTETAGTGGKRTHALTINTDHSVGAGHRDFSNLVFINHSSIEVDMTIRKDF